MFSENKINVSPSLTGNSPAVVDMHGKVSLPLCFRNILPENEKRFYLSFAKNKHLALFRESDYNENIKPKILALPSEERIKVSHDTELVVLDDKQNRFTLSKRFREHIGITDEERDVCFIGALDKILVCSKNTHKEIYDVQNKYEYDL